MIKEITADEVNEAIKNNEKAVLLDVRTKEEFGRNRIKGAINIPVDEVKVKAKKVLPDKEALVYVYCLSGSRSEVATEELQILGYTNVFNMTGGLLVWRIRGFETET